MFGSEVRKLLFPGEGGVAVQALWWIVVITGLAVTVTLLPPLPVVTVNGITVITLLVFPFKYKVSVQLPALPAPGTNAGQML